MSVWSLEVIVLLLICSLVFTSPHVFQKIVFATKLRTRGCTSRVGAGEYLLLRKNVFVYGMLMSFQVFPQAKSGITKCTYITKVVRAVVMVSGIITVSGLDFWGMRTMFYLPQKSRYAESLSAIWTCVRQNLCGLEGRYRPGGW